MMLNILPGRLQTNVIIPIATNQCKVIFDYYYNEEVFVQNQEYIHEDIRFADEVQKEDATICKAVFQGLSSRAYSKGRFSVETESGVYAFQQWYRQQMCFNQ
jgi:choline monooxygenase